MEVKRLVVGSFTENTYVLGKSGQALIIDPGDEGDRIKEAVNDMGVTPLKVLLTHSHHDHIGELDNVRDLYDISAYIHPAEKDWFENPDLNMSIVSAHGAFTRRPAEHFFQANKTYHIGPFTFKVVETPGHTPGGVSFIFPEEKVVFTGDALIKDSIGPTNLPGSEPRAIVKGIHKQLFPLDDDYIVYGGHRDPSTIGHEKKHNPYCGLK